MMNFLDFGRFLTDCARSYRLCLQECVLTLFQTLFRRFLTFESELITSARFLLKFHPLVAIF